MYFLIERKTIIYNHNCFYYLVSYSSPRVVTDSCSLSLEGVKKIVGKLQEMELLERKDPKTIHSGLFGESGKTVLGIIDK